MTTACRENKPNQAQEQALTTPTRTTTRPFSASAGENRGVPRLALSKAEASAAIGCSVDFFDEHVLCELCVVRRGRRVFVPVAELERWLDREAERTLGQVAG